MTTPRRLVLACSGAPHLIAAIPALARDHRADVVTVTLDLGHGADLDDIRQRALAAGALRAHVLDAREEFAREYILPAIRAGALDGPGCPVSAALDDAIVARKLVEIANIEQAALVAHGWAPGTAGHSRIEAAVRALDPTLRIVAAAAPSTPSPVMPATRAAASAPDAPACVELTFEGGLPVAINGVEMTLTELLESMATIAAGHGVRADVLQAAYETLVAGVTRAEVLRSRRDNAARYATLIERGEWFAPDRGDLDRFNAGLQPHVTGTVRVELFKSACTVAGWQSRFALEPARA